MDIDLFAPYRCYPMQDGDAVLLLPELKVATELEQLGDAWHPDVCRSLASTLVELGATDVRLGVARPDALPLPGDHRLHATLRAELAGTDVVLHDLVALPAAGAEDAAA